jgi:hypothetical protein
MSRFIQKYSMTLPALLALLILFSSPQLTGSAASAHFFYFNPDSAQSNLSGLKQSMDTYLTAEGFTFSFQPFTRFRDFDRQVKEVNPALIFLPEWYLKQDGNDKKFKPFMIPVHKKVTTYRKVLLVTADSALTTAKLTGATMAMTPVGSAGMTMLNEAIFKANGINPDTLNVITTAKDSDALFALTLGQVNAALISEENLNSIGAINPQILKTVKTLAVSTPIPLPVLCYAEGAVAGADLDKLRKSLLAGKSNKDTARLMELLDIDAWQPPSL